MRVDNQISNYVGTDAAFNEGRTSQARQTGKVSISGQEAKKGNTFFMGDLLMGQFDPIAQKRELARRQAYRIVSDTYADERKMDNDLQGRAEHAKRLRKEKWEAKRQIMLLDQQKEELREQYGVPKDSREQKDIETLQWMQDYSTNKPSADQLLHAYQIREEDSYTDYQRRALAADSYEEQERLRGQYGVSKDSSEQQELETLQWLRDNESKAPTAEDIKSAERLKSSGSYTEYQRRVLELESYKQPYQRTIQICDQGFLDQAGIQEEYSVIRATELERLKKDPMLEASQQAEEILASASKEIIGMLVEEAKDNIEEDMEEQQEKAEERKEEEKAEQEKIEEVRERREELEALLYPEEAEKKHDRPEPSEVLSGDALTQNLLKMDGLHNDIKQELGDMIQKMNLVAEDLKGIRVDETL